MAWINARRPILGSMFLTHGEPRSIEALQAALAEPSLVVIAPEIGERYELPAGAPARRTVTGRAELRNALGRDWQNEYADFAANLKDELKRIPDAERRARAIAHMRSILDDYAG